MSIYLDNAATTPATPESEKMLYSGMVEQALERAVHNYRQRDSGKLKATAGN
jgi:cysteine sulfinate desulfinase/cysteine desulfurase-like protein